MTPSAFATAIMRRGVDAGIREFRRFALARTTSANTFEPRYEGAYLVGTADGSAVARSGKGFGSASLALERLLALRDQLPADRKVGKRWRFVGLRGGIEVAMLRLAAAPSDSEAACALLDATTAALDRIDRNRGFRERPIVWEPLPVDWVPDLFGESSANAEKARLALALVSGFPSDRPCASYRFGVETERGGRFVHPEVSPARWTWRSGVPLPRQLAEILRRRTIDWGEASEHGGEIEPARSLVPAADVHVENWLLGAVDDDFLRGGYRAFLLFDWRRVPHAVKAIAQPGDHLREASGSLCLFGLLSPLFNLQEVFRVGRRLESLLPRDSGARTAGAARRLLGLLRTSEVAAAVNFASSRYAMAGAPLLKNKVEWNVRDPDRLAGSLLFSVNEYQRGALVERWLRPDRNKEV